MRRSKEIIVLLALLLGAIVFVLWYVAQRRAEMRAAPTASGPKDLGPVAPQPVPFVDLGGKNEAKTIDFSGGKPVVKDTPEDRAALERGLKEIEEATKSVTFEAPKKK
ncbi:MAG: hypothetical protein C0518_01195 [Opitutus sp.]|nr:hypothetical protein [Opitutus sp.]